MYIALASSKSTTTSVGSESIGHARITPASLAADGKTTVLTLEAFGEVISGVTGTLVLYDLTAGAAAATLTWTETDPTRKTASVEVPGVATSYELRFSKSGGGDSDYAYVGGVNIVVTWE